MTIYNKICETLNEIRNERKKYTSFYVSEELRPTVNILISCEEALEAEARKYCSSNKMA